jgi:hypothetical protein
VVVDQPVEASGQAGEFNGRGGHIVSTRVPAPGASCTIRILVSKNPFIPATGYPILPCNATLLYPQPQ